MELVLSAYDMSENPENIVLKVQKSIDHVKDLIRYSPSIARLERNLEGDHDEKDKSKDETKETSSLQNDTAHVVEENLQIPSETPVNHQKKTDLLQDRIKQEVESKTVRTPIIGDKPQNLGSQSFLADLKTEKIMQEPENLFSSEKTNPILSIPSVSNQLNNNQNNDDAINDETPILVEIKAPEETIEENQSANRKISGISLDRTIKSLTSVETSEPFQDFDTKSTQKSDENTNINNTNLKIENLDKKEITSADNKELPKLKKQGGEPNVDTIARTSKVIICCSLM